MLRVVRMFGVVRVGRVLGMIGAGRTLAGRRFSRCVGIQKDAPAGGDQRGQASVAQLPEGVDFIVSVHTGSSSEGRCHW